MKSNTTLTLGSLFDGSGGFPLGGLLCGITPVWASEIEPFPIRVGFKGTLTSSTITGSEPSITIASTGYASDNTSPDIGVYGNIVNSTGDVTIKNANRNIYIVGSANVTGKTIHITADQGSVSQTSEV